MAHLYWLSDLAGRGSCGDLIIRHLTDDGDVADDGGVCSSRLPCWSSARGTLDQQQPRRGPSLRFRRQGGECCQAIRRSRGGRLLGGCTSKIHCLADDGGQPVVCAIVPGNVPDISMAIPLLSALSPPRCLIADKAYGADGLRSWLKARHVRAGIPSTASRTNPYPLDGNTYVRRNPIERLFCRLKNGRRIATRHDRLA